MTCGRDGPSNNVQSPRPHVLFYVTTPTMSYITRVTHRTRALFPFGPAPSLICLIFIISATLLFLFPVKNTQPTLEMWTFARNHMPAYIKAIDSFTNAHPGVIIDLKLVDQTAVSRRLEAAFWSDLAVPDMVEVLTTDTGHFFRGPLKDIGFWDITDQLHASGLYGRIVTARFASCSSRGRIFGVPHDVHPVMLAYRTDIFQKEGISTNDISTWEDFHRIGQRVTKDTDGDGIIDRYMIEMTDANANHFYIMLLQAGGGYFSSDGSLILDNAIAVSTLYTYVQFVAPPRGIGNAIGWGKILTQAMENDYFVCLFCPDWRTQVIESDIASLHGKLALMPLPAMTKGGRKTSTWGGTMLGITKKCLNKELAWEFMKHLYFSKEDLGPRFATLNILPPVKDSWDHPAFDTPRPYWSSQAIGRLYADVAPDVPPVYVTPFSRYTHARAGEAVLNAVRYYKEHGTNELYRYIKNILTEKADTVRKEMARNPYQ